MLGTQIVNPGTIAGVINVSGGMAGTIMLTEMDGYAEYNICHV